MKIQIIESAKIDLIDSYSFYEEQSHELGQYFLDCLFSDIDSLMLYGGIHPLQHDIFYCMLAQRFPYAIYYRIENQTVTVFAVLDCRQDPENIKDRLSWEKGLK
ncbi:MAG: type II toxin-antitoxin system RelE/ParE family toxin [Lentisphaeria bacterium]|nr:type II toxin-antitoxin system RelE/ParE family toxin [Lentisphaeria bacterium]NQZ66606.1 type II toxin-antitoxin system RelE/ParE family toxin [Lentisphaeria bacterium]